MNIPALLPRLVSLFRRPAPRPGPYALDDPEQDGPAWVPTPEQREQIAAALRDALEKRIERDKAVIERWLADAEEDLREELPA